jgi:O6-methylguanine-DNA--protein-cysteine methyltransferase
MRHEQNLMVFKTPIGWAGVSASEEGISKLVLPKKDKKAVEKELKNAVSPHTPPHTPGGRGSEKILERTAKLLGTYFSGKRVSFDLPVDMRYHTAFRQAVWKAAAEIPFGETRSYAWIAKRIGNPRAVRAVGQALGANPIPIIIP